ncbi:PAS domain-containing hybrid sensor histidine kinase/response regulator [Bremerella alba]|uniref:histidine kinase n=1 Tax=Bremerella alba TaxID=980252 RepID=A0A7V8V194_9BACT|nr:PAS domain-containing hybrid sensor histidine kinase/response regulator [Bremerella alba]MBA2113041.1 Sensor histidine kinase RcsC [Bremerella alba]
MMDYEKIRIAIIAEDSESARILPHLHDCGVRPQDILCVEPQGWPDLNHDQIGLCLWGVSPQSSAHQNLPDPRLSPAILGQCLNVYIEAGLSPSRSPYVLEWVEFDSPQINVKLQHLIEEAQVREDLRQHQQWYRLAVAEGNVGLWWWDRQLDFVYLSQHFQKMLGLEPSHLPRNVNEWLSRVHVDDRFKVTQTIENQFSQNDRRFELECRIQNTEGRYRWYTLSGQFQSSGCHRKRVLGTATDITEKREAELALITANELANSAVNAKNEFLTNMSHNLRTPLTAILGHADLLGSDWPDGLPGPSLEPIRRNGQQLMHLLDDIMELSCIESAQQSASMGKTSVEAILADTADVYQTKAKRQGLDFHLHVLPGIPPEFVTDAARTRLILTRLIENAIKFTPEGEITVEVSFHGFPKPTLQLIVRDTGVGIPASRLDTIFEPFNQADNSPSRCHGGSGLGLSICHRLVKTLNGSLDVESEVGNGTSFLLRIPLEVTSLSLQEQPRQSGPQKKPQQVRLDGYRVLLVEDGIDNQVVLSAFLRKAGATVTLANNGLEAVEWISANRRDTVSTGQDSDPRVDLILMDMQMPVMDGYQATGLLRENGFCKPILAVTAHALQGDRQRCLDAGCDDYFTKPVKRGPFLEFVKRYGTHAQHLATTLEGS